MVVYNTINTIRKVSIIGILATTAVSFYLANETRTLNDGLPNHVNEVKDEITTIEFVSAKNLADRLSDAEAKLKKCAVQSKTLEDFAQNCPGQQIYFLDLWEKHAKHLASSEYQTAVGAFNTKLEERTRAKVDEINQTANLSDYVAYGGLAAFGIPFLISGFIKRRKKEK